jgi:SSS family solute:Na+ symporter
VTAFYLICGYLFLLVCVALFGKFGGKRNSAVDFFLASRTCGAFLLVMTIFGTTMSAFALVGSTGEAFLKGIGVYGQMASWSALVHSACFLLIGTKLWYHGKRFGYSTQIQYFRDRFQSPALGYVLFPILVGLVVLYVVINIVGSGATIFSVTAGAFPHAFPTVDPHTSGGVPPWLGSGLVCLTVLIYVFSGGMRSLSFANALHASVLIALGGVIMFLVLGRLGGATAASAMVASQKPELLIRGENISQLEFLTYLFVPLSVGMFPHLFQHWMTAKNVKTFRTVLILHPIFILMVWAPCILLGIWAAVTLPDGHPVITTHITSQTSNQVLGMLVKNLTQSEVVAGFLGVGIVSATMSLDSQFLALSSMFTHDILVRLFGEQRLGDKQRVLLGRLMVLTIVALAYTISLLAPRSVFKLGVWCFSGFSGLFPLVFASLYWRRVTRAGAMASIAATVASWLYLFSQWFFGSSEKYLFLGMMPAASIVFVSAVTLVVVSLLTRPPEKEVVERFFSEEKQESVGETLVHAG